jgi:hypothetical protein
LADDRATVGNSAGQNSGKGEGGDVMREQQDAGERTYTYSRVIAIHSNRQLLGEKEEKKGGERKKPPCIKDFRAMVVFKFSKK